ncbi:MAG: SCO family protein [Acidimicrobiales bacterium]
MDSQAPETLTTSYSGTHQESRSLIQWIMNHAISIAVALVVIMVGTFAFLVVRIHDERSQPIAVARVSGIPKTLSSHLAFIMSLSPLPKPSAPGFTLTDQHGKTISLSSYKGRAIVLTFMDPHCTDICPLVSAEFIDAYHDLGADAPRVTFLAVNVNKYHASVAAMDAFSSEHSLNGIPSWHFVTGRPNILKSTWKKYGITVYAPSRNADVIHAAYIYFIDPNGRMRYLANPSDLHSADGKAYLPPGSLTSWGKGISILAKSMLK